MNIVNRQKDAKRKVDFSHSQSTKANNVKDFGQIHLLDKPLCNNVERIIRLVDGSVQHVTLHPQERTEAFLKKLPDGLDM